MQWHANRAWAGAGRRPIECGARLCADGYVLLFSGVDACFRLMGVAPPHPRQLLVAGQSRAERGKVSACCLFISPTRKPLGNPLVPYIPLASVLRKQHWQEQTLMSELSLPVTRTAAKTAHSFFIHNFRLLRRRLRPPSSLQTPEVLVLLSEVQSQSGVLPRMICGLCVKRGGQPGQKSSQT